MADNDKYSEQNLLIPIIIALGNARCPIPTESLYPVLERMLKPWGKMLTPYAGRTDTSFSQTIRNFTGDERLTDFKLRFIEKENGLLSLTDFGKEIYNAIFANDNKNSIQQSCSKYPLQRIYYGAPGTGKSNEIKILTGEGKDGIKYGNDFTFRTTFHPDSDYSSFVGAYKPIWDDEKDKIIYEFRPQTFLKAYIAAWTNPDQNVALVIEEINRGNCAQIFGDIFQLLDRDSHGLSKYPIEADIDMQKSLKGAFSGENQYKKAIPKTDEELVNNYYEKHYTDAFKQISEGKILTLPKNLSILATMNTSDQSLFPMDSAFKRRWEWMYQPIDEGVDRETNNKLKWKIQIDGYESIDWWEFLKRINRVISNLTSSEDKQLGYFFCLPDLKTNDNANNTLISTGLFVNKVIFYLWNDVFKDYAYDDNCCRSDDGSKIILFADFHKGNKVNLDVLKHFFETLRIDDEESLLIEKKSENNTDDKLVKDTDPETVEDD